MKIAVCFSGQIRTGVETSKNILTYVTSNLLSVDFFVHTWNIETISKWGLNGRDKSVADVPFPVSKEKLDKFEEIYRPKRMVVDDYTSYINTKRQMLGGSYTEVPLFHSNYEVIRLKREYEIENKFVYDLVLRIRPDILFDTSAKLIDEVIYIGSNCRPTGHNMLYVNDTFNVFPEGIDDMCWLGTSEVLDLGSNFVTERESDITNIELRSLDWQVHHKRYLDNNKIPSRPFRHNSLYAYRDYHAAMGIDPMDVKKVESTTVY